MRKIMDRLVTGDAEIKEIDMLEELSYQVLACAATRPHARMRTTARACMPGPQQVAVAQPERIGPIHFGRSRVTRSALWATPPHGRCRG